MSTLLGTVVADFTTNLATAITVGGTTATLQSATDDDGVALPSGRYFFTIDGENSSKEHFACNLSGTSLSALYSVSRQGVETSGAVRSHRIGATVTLTDFAHIQVINDLVAGTTDFNASVPLGYDGTASITTDNQFATKVYADNLAIAGAPDATLTVKGILELATAAEVVAKTATGGTGAALAVTPDVMPSTLLSDYKADTGAADAYVITPAPAIASYTTGQRFTFKVTNTNLTTTPTLNVNALGAKTIVKRGTSALQAGDLLATQIVEVEYDGTNFQLMSPVAVNPTPTGSLQMFAASSAPTGWLLCDASAISRTTYAALFAVIGTTYGAGDASTTFNVPDMRGRVPVGAGTGTGGAAAGTGLPTGGSALTAVALAGWKGAETHTLITSEMPAHAHDYPNGGSGGTPSASAVTIGSSYTAPQTYDQWGSTGGGGAHNNIQPVLGVNFLIKT